MRVSQICVYHQPIIVKTPHKIRSYNTNTVMPAKTQENVNFHGKFGAWLGAIAGGAAVVAAAIATAPALVCLAGGGALIGGLGLDMAEDAINGVKDKN